MPRYAIGDIQGCYDELRSLLKELPFREDCDELWFVGDLVNRGPRSLEVLRFVRALADNAVVVLGNHDLHLLAVAFGAERKLRPSDTLAPVLAAADRDSLLDWLIARPLAHEAENDLLVHAGLVPQWTVPQTLQLAAEVERELQRDPARVFSQMYGNNPDRWDDGLTGAARYRFVINTLTRLRYCTADGVVDLGPKDAPGRVPPPLRPWFDVPSRMSRGTRIICGHWSTLGLVRRADLLALDTGCVWGGALTAVALDGARAGTLWSIPCAGYCAPSGGD
jgi:bis(5'-nucleosyl)-tetraphosphatase (symmetrical)